MINAEVPQEITFDLPEGRFDAVITCVKSFVKQTARGSQEWIRVLFDVEVPTLLNLDCRAGRNFQSNLKPGSDFRNWLTELLGVQFFKAKSGSSIDLEILEGTKCVVQLGHLHGKGDYDKPLVVVTRVFPRPEVPATSDKPKAGKS